MVLTRISHHPPAAAADTLAVTGLTPYGRFDVVSTKPAPDSDPGPTQPSPPMCLWHIGLCAPPHRHLDTLAMSGGEKCGLDSVQKNSIGILCRLLVISLTRGVYHESSI